MTIKPVTPADLTDPPDDWRSSATVFHAWNCEIAKQWNGDEAVVQLKDVEEQLYERCAFTPMSAYHEQFFPTDNYYRDAGWVVEVSDCRTEFTFTKPK